MTRSRTTMPIPFPPDKTGVVSWVHFGDLHMPTRAEQNYRDLLLLVDEVDRVMSGSLNFAYFPGDNAEHGAAEEYELVSEARDLLRLPSFAIVGDHDVHLKSHDNFLKYMMPEAFYSFEIGTCRFFALDSFAFDDPRVFDVSEVQLEWLADELTLASVARKYCVVLLHCYPSELGKSAEALQKLFRRHDVCLVDMGHTHYNEIAHDGRTLYTATRSTGQIEEGPVGFSIANIDRGVVSWRFKALGEWPLVMITFPADERLRTHHEVSPFRTDGTMRIRAKAWSDRPFVTGFAELAGRRAPLECIPQSALWQADLNIENLLDGIYPLVVELADAGGKTGRDEIRIAANSPPTVKTELRPGLDRDNVVGAWPERGILGTQLGPNKNGRKW